MKKLFSIFFCVFLVNNLIGQIENDKALHFLGGNLYGLAGAGIAKQISDGNRWWTFAGAIGGSALIGLGKEAVDSSQRPNGWDNDDLWATILGGTTVGFTIDIFTDHKKKKRRQIESFAVKNKSGTFEQMERLEAVLKIHSAPSLTTLAVPAELLVLE